MLCRQNLEGRALLLETSHSLCPQQPLIVELAVQDVEARSLLVMWQAANESNVDGFKVNPHT